MTNEQRKTEAARARKAARKAETLADRIALLDYAVALEK